MACHYMQLNNGILDNMHHMKAGTDNSLVSPSRPARRNNRRQTVCTFVRPEGEYLIIVSLMFLVDGATTCKRTLLV